MAGISFRVASRHPNKRYQTLFDSSDDVAFDTNRSLRDSLDKSSQPLSSGLVSAFVSGFAFVSDVGFVSSSFGPGLPRDRLL